jgi:hypothetical protein
MARRERGCADSLLIFIAFINSDRWCEAEVQAAEPKLFCDCTDSPVPQPQIALGQGIIVIESVCFA